MGRWDALSSCGPICCDWFWTIGRSPRSDICIVSDRNAWLLCVGLLSAFVQSCSHTNRKCRQTFGALPTDGSEVSVLWRTLVDSPNTRIGRTSVSQSKTLSMCSKRSMGSPQTQCCTSSQKTCPLIPSAHQSTTGSLLVSIALVFDGLDLCERWDLFGSQSIVGIDCTDIPVNRCLRLWLQLFLWKERTRCLSVGPKTRH